MGHRFEQHPRPALSGSQHDRFARHQRPAGEQLFDQPRQGTPGQSVRRQGRSQSLDEQPVLRAIQLQEDAPPAACHAPHGDAGATFGAGDGNIKAQGFAFNDTHTFGSNWLNEARFGWTSIKFFMTSIDFGQNLAAKVGIPGINTAPATSAMSQLTFQNIRNLGSNSNQPLITNQNDFQIFDNVTWIKGRHTLKTGGSLTLRSREVLNADNPVGQFQFNNNQTSNCAGQPASCLLNSNSGWDVASFLLGYTAQ